MRIISRYRLIYSGEYTCYRCGTLFALEDDDQPSESQPSHLDRAIPPECFFSCPSCGHPVPVSEQRQAAPPSSP